MGTSSMYKILFLSLLPLYMGTFTCYNNLCVGTDAHKTTIPCDQKLNNCTVGPDGTPVCKRSLDGGNGVNCTTTEDLDEYYCENDATTGAAMCVYPPKHDCYDTICTGKDAFNTTTIPCDQSSNRCGFEETGAPKCINTTRGGGVDCPKDDEFYCSVDKTDGSGVCVVPPKYSCYDTKCVGASSTIDCDQKDHRCVLDDAGEPTCVNTTRGNGVDCTTTEDLDEYYCENNATTGAAMCVYPAKHDCYDTTCTGKDAFNTTTIPCDQSSNRCGFEEAGAPKCINTTRGDGVDCSRDDEFYCSVDKTDGSGVCVVPPKYSCYDTKCVGTSSTIDCDQKDHRCVLDDAGEPTCVNTTRGNGVDCTLTIDLDEYYCDNNATTGAAMCVYPPKHDCYDTTCTGKDTFNTTTIPCDQSSNRCGFEETGAPKCINTTRGGGVACSADEGFSCDADDSGAALCVALPTYSCYDNKCTIGALAIDCDQSRNKCVLDEDGLVTCVNNTRGHGVDCTGQYTCGNDPDTGAAICEEVYKLDCYDKVCTGTGTFNTTVIPCDQSVHSCSYNSSGSPTCTASPAGGTGVNCTGPDSNLTSPLDFHCNITSPTAQCVFTPPHSCYSQFCKGTGDKESSWVGCDGTSNVCHVTDDGSPVCTPGSRGAGVDCQTDSNFYCSPQDNDPFTAACRYSEPYSCYNTKCRGVLDNSNSYVDCPQSAGYCGVDLTGIPVCILHPDLTGDGVQCTGEYTCSADPVTGVASCNENTGTSTAVWVVVGLALVVAGVVLVVWYFKRRSRVYGDRELLLSPESF